MARGRGKKAALPSGNGTCRIDLSVPAWMRRLMLQTEGVNWSRVAQEAFARFLTKTVSAEGSAGKDCRP